MANSQLKSKKLCEKAKRRSRNLWCSHISHYHGHTYHQWFSNPLISYSLVASSMSDKQINKIQQIIHPQVIACKDFNRNWTKALRYGEHELSGIALIDLRVEQRVRKLQFMKKMLLYPKHKILIQIIIEWYHISAGLIGQILSNPTDKTSYVSSVWFQDIITFLFKNNIHVITYQFFTIKFQRINDRCIMYELIQLIQLNVTKTELIKLNACRMYLQVLLLSDITTPNGKTIIMQFLRRKKPKYPRSTFNWPNQDFPRKLA